MAPKIAAKTDAELALEKRYELLRKKKEEKAAKKAAADAAVTASKQHGGASLSGPSGGLTKASEDAADLPSLKEPVGTAPPSKPAVAKLPERITFSLSGHREQTNAPAPTPSKTVPKKNNRLTSAPVATHQTPSGSVSTPSQTGGRASSSSPACAPGPLSAFERTKMILAKEAQKKRPSSPAAAAGAQLKGTHAYTRECGVPLNGSAAPGHAVDAGIIDKAAAVTARDRAAALLMVERQPRVPKNAGSACGQVSGLNTHGANHGGVEAPARKAPNLKRPAARATETLPIKRVRGGEVGASSLGNAADVANDAIGVVDGVGERESKEGREVFVGDLPDNCTIEAVASALYRFGNVNSVRVMEARNFGFVTFADREGAAKAVEACRAAYSSDSAVPVEVRGRVITVDYARGSVPGWKRGDSLNAGDDENITNHKFLAGVRSKAIEEYTKTKAGGVGHVSGSDGSSKRDLVVYDDI